MLNYKKEIMEYIRQEIEIMEKLDIDAINEIMNVLEEVRESGNIVYICGNGGSAATASHFMGDFNKGVSITKDKKYKFMCLNDNVPTLMAIANDISYDDVFVFPLRGRMERGDILLAISGSGNSENVIRAAKYTKDFGNKVVGITGYSGGKLKKISDYNLYVPIDNMQIVEDIHLMFEHLMMYILAYAS